MTSHAQGEMHPSTVVVVQLDHLVYSYHLLLRVRSAQEEKNIYIRNIAVVAAIFRSNIKSLGSAELGNTVQVFITATINFDSTETETAPPGGSGENKWC